MIGWSKLTMTGGTSEAPHQIACYVAEKKITHSGCLRVFFVKFDDLRATFVLVSLVQPVFIQYLTIIVSLNMMVVMRDKYCPNMHSN